MKLFSVKDIEFQSIVDINYDMGIFASTYEKRCTFIAKQILKEKIECSTVFGKTEQNKTFQQHKNDDYYNENWTENIIPISENNDDIIFEILSNSFEKESVKILIDYSSMPRLWYTAILNWARYSSNFDMITIDFVYSEGKYRGLNKPMVIKEILSIPGCEGVQFPFNKSVVIFGLGFDGIAPLTVLDRLEPDVVYAFLASPGSLKSYPKKTINFNKPILSWIKEKNVLHLPLDSVEQTYRYLSDIVESHKENHDISIIPMGPKPHVLSSILLAFQYNEIACLRVSTERESNVFVYPQGEVMVTRVVFNKE